MHNTTFLIVDSDERSAAMRVRLYERMGEVSVASTIMRADSLLTSRSWTGLVLNAELSDGSGLAFLDQLRLVHRRMGLRRVLPVLLCPCFMGSESATDSSTAMCTQALRLDAILAAEPDAPQEHQRFAYVAIAADYLVMPVADHVAHIASLHRLPMMQTRILALAVSGVSRDRWCPLLSVTPNTLKSHIARMCRKTGARSVIELARPILRQAVAQPALH